MPAGTMAGALPITHRRQHHERRLHLMCGIGGWLGYVEDASSRAAVLARKMEHRGPDGTGIKLWPAAALTHNRLQIIDLSPLGAQPMSNEDGTVWIALNGEIFNHHALRSRLEAAGHTFRGRCDSEVVPHLYEEYGAGFVDHLTGQFAVAIYDVRHDLLHLARDRFGIKPLFYSVKPHLLAFASEIGALRTLPGIGASINMQAAADLAAMCYVPAPDTWYRDIAALQPGCHLTARLNGERVECRDRRYHTWCVAPNPAARLGASVDCASSLITEAVASQMESDVPLGALLSGGIDSSLVSAAAARALRGDLHTYNVQFPDRDYDETWAAVAAAESIGSHHETLEMTALDTSWESITSMLIHAGQPFADTSLFGVNAVSRLMRSRVTVALSGDGGDEAFGGYDAFWQVSQAARIQAMPRIVRRAVAVGAGAAGSVGAIPATWPVRLREMDGLGAAGLLANACCWMRPAEAKTWLAFDGAEPVTRLFEPQWRIELPAGCSKTEELSARLTEVFGRLVLPSDFLFKVDCASMRESLEVRVPMLDERLFEYGLTMPHALKVRKAEAKRVLRGVAQRWLPPAVARKPKRGFSVPMDRWTTDAFKAQLREELLSPNSPIAALYRPEKYRPVVEAFCAGRSLPGISRRGLFQRTFMLLSAHLFGGTTPPTP
ncbi:MAG: asparagine synthase (glutamine-hydrolyzing) [Armatimonadetes bacterium]|nr:asparagine synthase (glutamine-hydrolyzing) [Armatimonadota bacterium]MDE2205524.1 asparagine synthase (glutamine-hydrolyzing) [Armatimonadota bacterium]